MSTADADRVEKIFLDKWYGIDVHDATVIIDACSGLSDEQRLARPVLVTAAVTALQRVSPENGEDHAHGLERFTTLVLQPPESAIGSSLSGVGLRRWRLMEMIARRWRRDYRSALDVSDLLDQAFDRLGLRDAILGPSGDGLWPGHVSLQRGVTQALAGSLSSAMSSSTRAYNEGGSPPH